MTYSEHSVSISGEDCHSVFNYSILSSLTGAFRSALSIQRTGHLLLWGHSAFLFCWISYLRDLTLAYFLLNTPLFSPGEKSSDFYQDEGFGSWAKWSFYYPGLRKKSDISGFADIFS
jgi:hypothetical protein